MDAVILIYLLLPSVAVPVNARRSESRFLKSSLCGLETRLEHGCSHKLSRVHGLHRCLQMCDLDPFCEGASVDAAGACFLHEACSSVASCSGSDPGHLYWARHCVYGRWNSTSGSCVCTLGCLGDRCDRCPKTCLGLAAAGFKNGHHVTILNPSGDKKSRIKVHCLINPPSYERIMIARNTGGMDFNRTWKEYGRGFFKDNANIWGGLRNWHQLSQAGYNEVTLNLRFRIDVGVYRVLKGVFIKDEINGFSFTVDRSSESESGNVSAMAGGAATPYFGACLETVQENRFSTWDRDNDGSHGENCASRAGSGWWFGGCDAECNLLGWGLDAWEATPAGQRLKVMGVDSSLVKQVDYVEVYVQNG